MYVLIACILAVHTEAVQNTVVEIDDKGSTKQTNVVVRHEKTAPDEDETASHSSAAHNVSTFESHTEKAGHQDMKTEVSPAKEMPPVKEVPPPKEKAAAPAKTAVIMGSDGSMHTPDDDMEDDVSLDELEAMTIAKALMKKHYVPPPAIECKWTEWKKVGDCSRTCGKGQQKRTRKKQPKAAYGGRDCQGESEDYITCDAGACPTTTTTITQKMASTTVAKDGALHMSDLSMMAGLTSLIVASVIHS